MQLLEVENLKIGYHTRKGELLAVDGVSFSVSEQETIGIVGESGCGKSTLALAILKLIPYPGRVLSGSVKLNGQDIVPLEGEKLREVRGRMVGMIFQDPASSLNPVKKVGDHFVEALITHYPEMPEESAREKAEEIVKLLGVAGDRLRDYPHQLSGGMKQRMMIGLALVLSPQLLVADEPTTALDVIIEAQILELLKELKEKLKLSMILITHNLAVVAEVADRIAIMYAGQFFEVADAKTIFRNPMFPYTQLLLKLVPNIEESEASLDWIPGSPPDLIREIKGCRFSPRCPYVFDRCKTEAPLLVEREKGHFVACHLYDKGGKR